LVSRCGRKEVDVRGLPPGAVVLRNYDAFAPAIEQALRRAGLVNREDLIDARYFYIAAGVSRSPSTLIMTTRAALSAPPLDSWRSFSFIIAAGQTSGQ